MNLSPVDLQQIAHAVADELEARGTGRPAATPSPFLDVDEAAAYLRAGRQRIYDLTHAGSLDACRDGRRLLFRREQLDAYLTTTSTPNPRPRHITT